MFMPKAIQAVYTVEKNGVCCDLYTDPITAAMFCDSEKGDRILMGYALFTGDGTSLFRGTKGDRLPVWYWDYKDAYEAARAIKSDFVVATSSSGPIIKFPQRNNSSQIVFRGDSPTESEQVALNAAKRKQKEDQMKITALEQELLEVKAQAFDLIQRKS